MRWEQLFADLDGRFEEIADATELAELADRQRVAIGAIGVGQRIRGVAGGPLRLVTTGGPTVSGTLVDAGPDWVLLGQGEGRTLLVALAAVGAVFGLTARTDHPLTGVARRFDLRLVLRGIARDRAPVTITLAGPVAAQDVSVTELTGTIDRVGADFIEVATHAPWEARRIGTVRGMALIPLAALATVRPMPLG